MGTQATVKSLATSDLEALGARIILGNTYHIWLRPGIEVGPGSVGAAVNAGAGAGGATCDKAGAGLAAGTGGSTFSPDTAERRDQAASFLARLLAGNGLFVDWGIEYVIFALLLGLLISNTIGTPEWLKPAVQTELTPGQSTRARYMPLEEFVDETMKLFGVTFGVVLQRSRFCLVRAFREPFVSGESEHTKAAALALVARD